MLNVSISDSRIGRQSNLVKHATLKQIQQLQAVKGEPAPDVFSAPASKRKYSRSKSSSSVVGSERKVSLDACQSDAVKHPLKSPRKQACMTSFTDARARQEIANFEAGFMDMQIKQLTSEFTVEPQKTLGDLYAAQVPEVLDMAVFKGPDLDSQPFHSKTSSSFNNFTSVHDSPPQIVTFSQNGNPVQPYQQTRSDSFSPPHHHAIPQARLSPPSLETASEALHQARLSPPCHQPASDALCPVNKPRLQFSNSAPAFVGSGGTDLVRPWLSGDINQSWQASPQSTSALDSPSVLLSPFADIFLGDSKSDPLPLILDSPRCLLFPPGIITTVR